MSEYDLIARIYDPVLHPAMIKIRRKIFEEINTPHNPRIIDLCCGTGNQLKLLRKNGIEAVGVDVSEAMLKQAEKGKNKATCFKQDATNTDFADNSFDIGIVSFALHEKPFSVAQQIIDEAKRLIKNNGKFIVTDYCFDKHAGWIGKAGISIVERFAGGEHFKNFKKFNRKRGLDKLITFPLLKENRFHFHATVLRVYKVIK